MGASSSAGYLMRDEELAPMGRSYGSLASIPEEFRFISLHTLVSPPSAIHEEAERNLPSR